MSHPYRYEPSFLERYVLAPYFCVGLFTGFYFFDRDTSLGVIFDQLSVGALIGIGSLQLGLLSFYVNALWRCRAHDEYFGFERPFWLIGPPLAYFFAFFCGLWIARH